MHRVAVADGFGSDRLSSDEVSLWHHCLRVGGGRVTSSPLGMPGKIVYGHGPGRILEKARSVVGRSVPLVVDVIWMYLDSKG